MTKSVTPSFGCSQCYGRDAASAWTAARATRLRALLDESHFIIQLFACSCGQRFVSVFTERIDWQDGEDEQTWVVVPVTDAESAHLETTAPDEVQNALTACAQGRRFLVRSFPPGASPDAWWREDGFLIGPHD